MSAPSVTAGRRYLVHFLILVRAAVAGLLPLTADEAYYWLWSRHLDWGYLDHPPAIAFLIRAGTLVFGDTAFAVRASGILLSGLATFFIFESARILLKSEVRAIAAALLFNLTLMANIELLAATPDMPSTATAAALLYCLARLQDGGHGRWWIGAGIAAGLSLLAKYSALFLIAGAFFWLLLSPRAKPWLKTIWPWAGAALALLIFLPHLYWQATHHWVTFAFQFGRVAGDQITARFIFEFLGAQLGLASPLLFVLGVMGLIQARRGSDLFLPAMLIWPAVIYFFIHALHDRVQGNWPAFLYPAFVILAVSAFADSGWRKWCAWAAAPVAALLLVIVYGQALTGFIPLRADPLARLLGTGFRPVANSVATAAHGMGGVLTTDYETTAWLRWYEPGLTVMQMGETARYPNAPAPGPALLARPLLYFVEKRRDRAGEMEKYFERVMPVNEFAISRNGGEFRHYVLYLVDKPKGPISARMP